MSFSLKCSCNYCNLPQRIRRCSRITDGLRLEKDPVNRWLECSGCVLQRSTSFFSIRVLSIFTKSSLRSFKKALYSLRTNAEMAGFKQDWLTRGCRYFLGGDHTLRP